MNTALADAAILNELLDEHKDDWIAVLPRFSEERVKEGNALTDLSFYTFSLSPAQQLTLMLRQNIRRTLNHWMPRLVAPDPMSEVSNGMKLSEAYHRMSALGVIPRVRATNDAIMRRHFEISTGMICEDGRTRSDIVKKMILYAAPVAVAGLGAWKYGRTA